MRIVLTGAGGGHFYPLIAVAERVKKEAREQKIIDADIYFLSDKEYNKNLLDQKDIKFVKIPSGKLRLYFSFQNLIDPLKSFFGFFVALFQLFKIYPDVVFAKGGYASMPVVFAAKLLFIPIIAHESDSAPGRSNLITAKLAKRVAISYANAVKYFNIKKTAFTGQPIMQDYLPTKAQLEKKILDTKNDIVHSENNKKNILVIGGSQGSEIINNTVLEALPELLEKYNIIHQVGDNNLKAVEIASEVLLKNNPNRKNYHFFPFGELSKYYESSHLCITRAGSTLFELSAWGIPSVIIPITNSNNNHQMINAYIFEKSGCSIVIEEINLKRNILINTIENILENKEKYKTLQLNNIENFKWGAAESIAKEIVKIGLSHNY